MVGKVDYSSDDEYQYFVAVEAGIVLKPLRIIPMCCWQAVHTFEIIPKKEAENKVVDDFYDLFNAYC